MKNIKARYIWISVAVSFIIAIGLIIGVTFAKGVWQNIIIGAIAVVFIYMTIAVQIASAKTFRYKAKPQKYETIEYEFKQDNFDELLKKRGYKPRVTPYGISYLKIEGINAYKVVLIRNFEKYFNQEQENTKEQPTEKGLEKCKKFFGFEIFFKYDEDTLRKIPDFNLQGDWVYYSGLYAKDDLIICPNYLAPNDTFKDMYNKVLDDLNLEVKTKIEE